ncbi:Methylated-DNA--protein-cysteine methyltransferase [compost metagenome]
MDRKPIHLYVKEIQSPIGSLVLVASNKGLCSIEFGTLADNQAKLERWVNRWFGSHQLKADGEALQAVHEQLEQYFGGERQCFELELDLQGTIFQKQVWEALKLIPYGETASYKAVAEAIGSPKAVRAVGGANNRNPIPVIIPCHRVIGASGKQVGYGGGLPIQTHLLQLEGKDGSR